MLPGYKLFKDLMWLEKSSLLQVRNLIGRGFQENFVYNDIMKNHKNGDKIIFHYNREILFGHLRYQIINAYTIKITSFVINKDYLSAPNFKNLLLKVYENFSTNFYKRVITETYLVNTDSIRFHEKLNFSSYKKDSLRIYFQIEMKILLKTLAKYIDRENL